MKKQLDFTTKQRIARSLSPLALEHAIRDCRRCIDLNIDPDYYRDEISVYQMELMRRTKKSKDSVLLSICKSLGFGMEFVR